MFAVKTIRAVISIAGASDFYPTILTDKVLNFTNKVLFVHGVILTRRGSAFLVSAGFVPTNRFIDTK